MICVLDTSAAIELYLVRPQSNELQELIASARVVVAPDLFCSEISNVFGKLFKAKHLTREQCEDGIGICIDLVDDLVPMSELAQEVFAASINHNATAYDMYFAVVARRYNARLLTIDNKLKEIARKMRIVV